MDIIKQFKLIQNEDLTITQKTICLQEKKEIIEEISTLTDYKKNDISKQSVNFNKHIDKNNFEIKIKHLDKKKI